MHHLNLLVDKSVLQSLSPTESKWLFHHFRINLPPVFCAEVLADLTKKRPITGSPEGDVIALAKKIVSHSVHINEEIFDIVQAELRGHRIPMKGQIADQQSQLIDMPDGSKGIFIDSTPTQDLIERWANGNFENSEHDFARVWRDRLSEIKLEELFRKVKAARNARVRSARDISDLVDLILRSRDYELIRLSFELYEVQEGFESALKAWRKYNRPPVDKFIPLTFFNLRVELFFLVALAHQVITTRDTNRIDIEYLKYLPFTQVFSSSDKLHIECAPLFLFEHNYFIPGSDLKKAMGEIANHWTNLSDDIKARGTATYADFPPAELDNAITRIYDFYIPNWRIGANEPRARISKEDSDRILAQLRPKMEAIERQRRKPPR